MVEGPKLARSLVAPSRRRWQEQGGSRCTRRDDRRRGQHLDERPAHRAPQRHRQRSAGCRWVRGTSTSARQVTARRHRQLQGRDGWLATRSRRSTTTGRTALVTAGLADATATTPTASTGPSTAYVRGVSFSPDGSYFVVAATGGGVHSLCDAVARFETYTSAPDVQPTWVSETGGDTTWAGGHRQRRLRRWSPALGQQPLRQ